MSQEVKGDRYVLYLPPAVENLERLDPSLEELIEGEIEKFLDIWNPDHLFDKKVTPLVGQIKKDRSVMRAFASWWDLDYVHILLVLQVYKKKDEDSFWDDIEEYNELARHYQFELRGAFSHPPSEPVQNLKDNPNYRLVGPE